MALCWQSQPRDCRFPKRSETHEPLEWVADCTRNSISRRMTLGSFRRFQADDYCMLLALCFYTTLVATINIVRFKNSNLLPPGYDVNHLAPEDIKEREYGSKLILVVEQCQCCTIWLAKACLLIMYLRITTLRKENLAIKALCGYVAFGFIFMEIFYFGVWCRPFYEYWQVPTSSVQCDAATNHLITNAVFNLSSDCIMIAIGLPMFLRMNLPWKKKIPLILIFSLGFFVILAAILNKVYSFSEPFGSLWTYWYVRESSTALLVANLPFVWTFWTFWKRAAGQKTVNGLSRQGSTTLEEVISRAPSDAPQPSDGESRRKLSEKRRPSLPWAMYGLHDGLSDMEMGTTGRQRTGGGLTLHEILRESNTDLAEDEHISPYTHPGLFFARQDGTVEGSPPDMPKTVVDKDGEHDLVRHDSDSEHRTGGTPVSSVFPQSLNSQKSAGSFL